MRGCLISVAIGGPFRKWEARPSVGPGERIHLVLVAGEIDDTVGLAVGSEMPRQSPGGSDRVNALCRVSAADVNDLVVRRFHEDRLAVEPISYRVPGLPTDSSGHRERGQSCRRGFEVTNER
jgi:hypothetical protein